MEEESSFESLISLGDLAVISHENLNGTHKEGQRRRLESQTSQEKVEDFVSHLKSKASHRKLAKTTSKPKGAWFGALAKTKSLGDPWEEHNIIETCKTERAKRFRYNALKKKWVQDLTLVKMQEKSFGKGAMRKCFRMKKLPSTVHTGDWNRASNIVAKRYIEDVLPKTYLDDVKLQMDAKLWAEEYNRYNPPKKIDIIQVACIQLIDRKDQPLYHFEHFVEGKYVKYNSNSGFVLHEEENVRATPQAFSHFTFERSGHQVIVVDIQGVGDLYTDPQIHTANEVDYGEANLGAKGMALFFASHQCTQICKDLRLESFDLSDNEKAHIDAVSSRSSTSTDVRQHSPDKKIEPMFELVDILQSVHLNQSVTGVGKENNNDGEFMQKIRTRLLSEDDSSDGSLRTRLLSEADSGNGSEEDTQTRARYFQQHEHRSSSCVFNMEPGLTEACVDDRLKSLNDYKEQQFSILGQIHYELALYNNIGRFTDTVPDLKSVLFHLMKASLLGSLNANKILAFKYFSLPTDEFSELTVEEDHDRGMDCLIDVATRGDKECMMKAAEAFYTGYNLGEVRKKSWKEALKYYEASLNINDAQHGAFNPYPVHEINAKMADIWRVGGFGVEKDPSYAGELYTAAADAAMNVGKGKLANKFFMLAEEAWGEVEED